MKFTVFQNQWSPVENMKILLIEFEKCPRTDLKSEEDKKKERRKQVELSGRTGMTLNWLRMFSSGLLKGHMMPDQSVLQFRSIDELIIRKQFEINSRNIKDEILKAPHHQQSESVEKTRALTLTGSLRPSSNRTDDFQTQNLLIFRCF